MNKVPLTTFLCDLIDAQMGRITTADVNQRLEEGRYGRIRRSWVSAYADLYSVPVKDRRK